MGIPANSAVRYETALKAGKFIVIAHGTEQDATRARETINRTAPEAAEGYQIPPMDAEECRVRA